MGTCEQLIDEDAVVGATSNPTIFQKAMSPGNAYDEQLRELGTDDVEQAFWALAEQDIREACDLFRPIWEQGLGSRRLRLLGGRPALGL